VEVCSIRRLQLTCLDSWSTMFQNKKYQGHNFLLLQNLDGSIIQPTYAKSGSWLGEVSSCLLVFMCMCRSILGHAPIRSYFQRFNINKSHWCKCGVPLQTCDHIFVVYRRHKLLHGDCTASAAISIYHFGQLSKRPDTSDWTVLHFGQLSKMIYYKDHKI